MLAEKSIIFFPHIFSGSHIMTSLLIPISKTGQWKLSNTNLPNFLDSKIYSHKPCPPQVYFSKNGHMSVTYLRKRSPEKLLLNLRCFLQSVAFLNRGSVLENTLFLFCIFLTPRGSQSSPLLPHSCSHCNYWCLRSHPNRKRFFC